MTDLNYAAIATALDQRYQSDLISSINRASVLTQLLEVRPAEGKNVAWDVRFGTTTGAAISDGSDQSAFNQDTKTPATLQFATYSDGFSITGRAEAAASASGGPSALMNLYGENVMESGERMAQGINTDLYMALLATGSYAGLARDTYPQWASNVLANGSVSRAISFTLLRDLRRTIYVASGLKPDLWICDPIQHEAIGNLYKEFRRYTSEITIAGQKKTLDGGYTALEFDGVPIVEDKDCPAGMVLALNTRKIFIRTLPTNIANMPMTATAEMNIAGTAEEQLGQPAGKLRARVQHLALTGDLHKFQVLTYLQLQVSQPNACGVLKDLA
jgi:hypothetical protein